MKTYFTGVIRKIERRDKGSFVDLENEITGETRNMFLYMKLPQNYVGYHIDIASNEKRRIIEPGETAYQFLSEQAIRIPETKCSIKLKLNKPIHLF